MHDTAPRLLELLLLLASRRHWTASELATRLDVTTRTVRRDVERLRRMDYPVASTSGPGGGYALGRGTRLPPLVLGPDEAVAVALCLRAGVLGAVDGVDEAVATALAKLDRMLPERLHARVSAMASAVRVLGEARDTVDVDRLVVVADAVRDRRVLRFDYTTGGGETSRRSAEPLASVHAGRHWYLVARDRQRDDWRTFRLDRVADVTVEAASFHHTDPPDAAALVTEALSTAPYAHTATVRLHTTPSEARRWLSPAAARCVADGDTTLLTTGAHELGWIAWHLARLPFGFTVVEPPELVDELRRLAEHVRAQVGS